MFDEQIFLLLSKNISLLWKFVAHLLGLTNDQIDEVEVNHKGMKVREMAYQMWLEWRKTTSGQSDRELHEQIFNALHSHW